MLGLGAYIGDISGSRFEFVPYVGEYENIPILEMSTVPTDDSVLTTGTMSWLIHRALGGKESAAVYYKDCGLKYPDAGYGHMFYNWLHSDSLEPFGSYGNGSAMRVSPVAWYANTFSECTYLAEESAKVTHNHPEGIKGAIAIAGAIYLAKVGKKKYEIAKFVESLGYDISRKVDDIKGTHKFDATCQVTVPEAIICFLESENFEDCVRKSIWIGGDVDTIGAMACPIAEAYYGIPYHLQELVLSKLDEGTKETIKIFNNTIV